MLQALRIRLSHGSDHSPNPKLALALANLSFCQSSGPMVQHYCHGITLSIYPKPVENLFNSINCLNWWKSNRPWPLVRWYPRCYHSSSPVWEELMGSLNFFKEVFNRLRMYGNGNSMAIVLAHRSTATSLTGNRCYINEGFFWNGKKLGGVGQSPTKPSFGVRK